MIRPIVSLLILVMPVLAHAESAFSDAPDSDVQLHANGGLELLGGPSASSIGMRAHLGVDRAFGEGHVRPTVGFGATIGLSSLFVSDLRALDGTVAIGQLDYGPELQLGLRFVDGGAVDSRVFASVAYLRTRLDERLMLDAVDGVGGTSGVRATIGANWADRIGASEQSRKDGTDLLLLVCPQQIELGWERSAGSDRFGVTFGWGI